MPYNLPMKHRGGEKMKDQDLHGNLATIKQMADASLVTIFHPGEEGFSA